MVTTDINLFTTKYIGMMLVDKQIKELIKSKVLEISPYDESLVQPNSIDVTLGNSFKWYFKTDNDVLDTNDPESLGRGILSVERNEIIIQPNQFLLAETREKIKIPSNIYAELHGKSSLARLGLTIHQTGGLIDSGFEGTITLEIKNENCRAIKLYAGMTIGQITFEKVEECETDYSKKEDAKYQNQSGATVSKYKMRKNKKSV